MRILHLSGEYPDELRPGTTTAVKRLVTCADTFCENYVISIHRRNVPAAERVRRRAGHAILCERSGPLPFATGYFFRRCLDAILEDRLASGFDLVHAHKLSHEGRIAWEIRRRSGTPYCVSVRATDIVVLGRMPYWRRALGDVLNDARGIAVIAPWMVPRLRASFGRRWSRRWEDKLVVLGNVVDGDMLFRTSHNGRYALVLKANKSQLVRKNVLRTFRAMRRLKRCGHRMSLDVIGGGTGMNVLRGWVRKLGLSSDVSLLGETPNAEMIHKLADYKALVLCSFPETFGLVYLEALRAGVPLVHARGAGVDGLFAERRIGVSARHDSEREIAAAWIEMDEKHGFYKNEVLELQLSGGLAPFTSPGFTDRLAQGLYGITTVRLPSNVELRTGGLARMSLASAPFGQERW